MPQQYKLDKTATTVYYKKPYTCVRYHETDVVRFTEDHIVLNSNGWRTATTLRRMNQASTQFDLGIKVFQKDFEWYVICKKGEIPFADNMVIGR
jgi:hypothetical protein